MFARHVAHEAKCTESVDLADPLTRQVGCSGNTWLPLPWCRRSILDNLKPALEGELPAARPRRGGFGRDPGLTPRAAFHICALNTLRGACSGRTGSTIHPAPFAASSAEVGVDHKRLSRCWLPNVSNRLPCTENVFPRPSEKGSRRPSGCRDH